MNDELGRKIRALRVERGMTQETFAEALGVTPQAVSKWENGVSAPDISMLPAISVSFGVTIDELFSLSDGESLERIDNMLCGARDLTESAFASTETLLRGIAARKPGCGDAYLRLAELYEHRIRTLTRQAVEHLKQAIRIQPEKKACHSCMTNLLHGYGGDWTCTNTLEMVRYYRELMKRVPDWQEGWYWLLDQLIGNGLLDEAREVIEATEKVRHHELAKSRLGDIAYAAGNGGEALRLWQECIDDAPQAWRPHAFRADRMVRMGRYDEAIRDYEAWLEKQPAPAFNDPYICMAFLYEEKGDAAKAIEMREKQLRVLREDFGFESGEVIDEVEREIARLRAI
ncbi:MAG: anaerobic benzoate catabolism transcriptional regulator [Firmicutes bacterium ADurb.Bin248]|nr:MAG: anaerobic benzoate catabolism transcriptional regulator [Firmicutes bacterium ADurb.Bin248]HOG00691.1 helix-turn-helix domain-containing protein [Clostridia bacterium]HPK15645.1 helix-turn-helix domain-containing protein [Clostridia bacterium]